MNANPWDRPKPRPTAGYPSAEGLFMAVGTALSQWEEIEMELVLIFKRILKLDIELTFVIYGNLPSIKSKMVMMTETGGHVYREKPEHLKYFKELMNLVEKTSERRNDIAHGKVHQSRQGGYLLSSPQTAKRGFDFKRWEGRYAFDQRHVLEYIELFKALQAELLDASPLLFGTFVHGSSSQTVLSRYLAPYKTVLQTMKPPPEFLPPPPSSQA